MAAVTAPSVGTIDLGNVLAKGGQVLKAGGRVLGAGAGTVGVAVGSIFASQSLGVDADKTLGLESPEGIAMANHAKGQAQAIPRTQTKDASCSKDDKSCKEKQDHRGNIQAQQEKGMLVATPAIAVWGTKSPPSYAFAVSAATAVRAALLTQKGQKVTAKDGLVAGDRGDRFQAGADKAHANILKILRENQTYGISAKYAVSCYFDGKYFFGANFKYRKEQSRRIDLTVHKGQLMGPGTK